jgi:hypothetical protein
MTATNGHPAATRGLLRQWCDPYGAETRIKLMGGLHPESQLGRHMWHCPRLAGGTYGMVCECGHRGQPMPLCGPGLVRGPDGRMMYHPGHVAELTRRQAGVCPKCVWPPEAIVLKEVNDAAEQELRAALMFGDRAAEARAKLKMLDAGKGLDELAARGVVHKCPLHLEEVS